MIFQHQFIDIIIKRSALEKVKEGLSAELIAEFKVGEGHYDEHLIIIRGGMNPFDVGYTVELLEKKYHLVHLKNNVAQDFVCAARFPGIYSKCPWLTSGFLNKAVAVGNTTYPQDTLFYEFVE